MKKMSFPALSFVLTVLLTALLTAEGMALPSQIILIRHAEKLDQTNRLDIRGEQRAAALAIMIAETKSLLTYGPPVAIYAMAAPNGESSMRSIDTVRPLANRLKLTVIDTFQSDDFKNMIEEIKKNPIYHGRNIVICWENKNIPEIARKFGALATPFKWNNDVYDRIWLINFSETGRASFQNMPQRLLFGDSAT